MSSLAENVMSMTIDVTNTSYLRTRQAKMAYFKKFTNRTHLSPED